MIGCIRMILFVLALSPLASGQEHRGGLEQARARWEHMSPAERARIEQHFAEFQGLPEAEREQMKSNLDRVAEVRRQIEERIPDELRAKLEQLEPSERHQVLREYIESAMGERAERLREKMSPELLQKLDSATPAEREELLRARLDELRKRAPRALEFLGRQLDLPREEIERLKALPPQEMRSALADLGRREMERRGPPPGVDQKEFRGWLELPPRECMERMHCHGMRGFRGEGDQHGPPPDGRPNGRPEGRDGDRGQRPGGPPPPDGPRGPRRESRLDAEGTNTVLRAMRPEPQWIVDLAGQPREQRHEEIEKRIHGRVVESLRTQAAVTPEEITRLDSLNGREFFDALREIIGDPPRGFGDRRRREHPRDDGQPPLRKD
jgi:hypothetical protein